MGVLSPIFGYALPLKRERWHAQRGGEGTTLPKVATTRKGLAKTGFSALRL